MKRFLTCLLVAAVAAPLAGGCYVSERRRGCGGGEHWDGGSCRRNERVIDVHVHDHDHDHDHDRDHRD